MPAIEVSHVTKEYQLGALKSLKQKLLNTGARLLGRDVEPPPPLFKALNDVNFSIEPGEVVGIIGHNGAGKSTLLKMLARISSPTSGHVKVNGRVAPLIEVGAGFVGDFTGRENVYLNGAILGMSKREIDRKFDEIVDFAEMAQFIDTPVKRYSSGMQVKLAFAVATSIEAEILIVDEVLAVGDLAFQRKCFDRMEDLIKREQRTVLLVSHNIRQVQRLCSRVLMLDRGQVAHEGSATEVCNLFYSQTAVRIASNVSHTKARNVSATGEVDLIDVRLETKHGLLSEQVEYNGALRLNFKIRVDAPLDNVTFGFGVHTTDFLYLATNNSETDISVSELAPGTYSIVCNVARMSLLPGVYSIRFGITAGRAARTVFYGENLLQFNVSGKIPITSREGFIALEASWHAPRELLHAPDDIKVSNSFT